MTITCYTVGADLMLYSTAERIRGATADERAASDDAASRDGGVGAFAAEVSARTLRRQCPMWVDRRTA